MFTGQSPRSKTASLRVSVTETITHCAGLLTRHTPRLQKEFSNLVSCFSLDLSFSTHNGGQSYEVTAMAKSAVNCNLYQLGEYLLRVRPCAKHFSVGQSFHLILTTAV